MQRTQDISDVEFPGLDETFFDDDRNIVLRDGDDVAVFEISPDGGYFSHCIFKSRGRAAIEAGKSAIKEFFNLTNQPFLRGLTPLENRPARWAARQMGFQSCGVVNIRDRNCELFMIRNDK